MACVSYSSAVQGVYSVTSVGWNEVRVSSLHWILSIREKVQDGLRAQNTHHTLQKQPAALWDLYHPHTCSYTPWMIPTLTHTQGWQSSRHVYTGRSVRGLVTLLMLGHYLKIVRSTLREESNAKLKLKINAKIFTHSHTQKRPFQEV